MAAVTFKIKPIGIPENSEGAARLLSYLSRPSNHSPDMKKLRDIHLMLEGERPFQNRSKRQVLDGVLMVWRRLVSAIRVGEWYDQSFLHLRRADATMPQALRDLASPLHHSIGVNSAKTVWKPWLPVAHLAAGFHITMLNTRRGRYFSLETEEDARIAEIVELLWNDHDWIKPTLLAAEGRLFTKRLHGVQPPRLTRHFVLTDDFGRQIPGWQESQK